MKSALALRFAVQFALGCVFALAGGASTQAAAPVTAARDTVAPARPAAAPAPAAGAGGASAQKPQEQPDTVILSDTLHFDDKTKTSVFTGNVVMTRGQMTLRADNLTARQDPQGNQYGTATMSSPDKLVFVREDNPEKFEVIEARGLRAEYNGKTSEIEMIGQAVVTRYVCGKALDKISGQRVRYNQKTDVYEAFSGPRSANRDGRVRSVAQPQAKVDAAIAECQRKSGLAASPRKARPHDKSSRDAPRARQPIGR